MAKLTLCGKQRIVFLLCFFLAALGIRAQTPGAVTNFAGNDQHTANYLQSAQSLNTVHWSTSVDLSNYGAVTHYGSPLISVANTVFVPVKNASGFQINAFNGSTGALLYSLTSDYVLPAYNWFPAYGPALTVTSSGTRLYFPGAGGTVYYIANPDAAPSGTPVQQAFYGLSNYQANSDAFNSTVFIDTPITSDSRGNIYFGFRVQGTAPAPLNTTQSGFARIDPNGNATYVLAGTAAADSLIGRDSHNSAPALSNDESTLYVLAKGANTDSYAYLLGLDSTSLATKYQVLLLDPRNGNYATVTDDSTASPMVGPDGDVYVGVFGNPNDSYRGFLLHFSGDLTIAKTPGAFGWDFTPAIVPSSMVPSYLGTSSYLIFSKYNNYAGAGDGDGVNRIALHDPNATQVDPHPSANGLLEMREVLTAIGVTPDADEVSAGYPLAVLEWCVNTPAVNPATNSIFVPSEDGYIYQWNLAENSLSQALQLTQGIGEAYVPVVIGPDGTVYTINGGNLYAVGNQTGVGVSLSATIQDLRTIVAGPPITFTVAVTNPSGSGTVPTGTVTFQATNFQSGSPVTYPLAANVPLDPTGQASITTANLVSGGNWITATYSGDAQFSAATSTIVEMVHASATTTTLASSSSTSGAGQPVTFTATVLPAIAADGQPTGMVMFEYGSDVLAQVPLSGGAASFVWSSPVAGTNGISALYTSDSIFALSSGNVSQTVGTSTNSAPTAQNVAIIGAPYVGQLLVGQYSYVDVNGDPQGSSIFQWLRDGTPIPGATGISYTPSTSDFGHYIVFEVTPVAASGASPGVAVESSGLLISGSASAGLLSGSGNYASNPANLTTEGNVDWFHWGETVVNRKITGDSLSNYTIIGYNGPLWYYANDPRPLNWTDGTPNATGTNDPTGVYLADTVGAGFSFTAPADTTVRTLVVHGGGYFSAATLTAHLSDSSAPDYVDVTSAFTTIYDRNYTLTYKAASPGQTLNVTWVESTDLGAGNVDLNATALSTFSGAVTPTSGNSQATVPGTVFATALQALVTDVNNNPLSGATVTFSAPTSGATAFFNGASTVTVVTGSNGIATAPTLTANTLTGGYYVIASVSGIPTTAAFSLTNVSGTPVQITALSGTPSDAVVNTPYTTALRAQVTDANGNAVSGISVTFSAPNSGPSGTFSTGTTASSITNSSGIVFAPAFTANGQAGSYIVTATAAPGVTATFSLTNTFGGNGSLSGSANNSSAPVDLTTVGTSDWIHWGDASLNRKASGGSQISNYSYAFTQDLNAQPQTILSSLPALVSGGVISPLNMGVELYENDPRVMSWNDGTPIASSAGNGDGLYIDYGTYVSSGRNGFTFTAPADGNTRTLTIYAGGNNSGGTLVAHLSDASAPDFVDTTSLVSGTYDRNYTFTYHAGSPGQTLTVTWVMTSSTGNANVTLSAAALSATTTANYTGTLTGSGTSSTATANLTSEGPTDWIHWGDSTLDRKAGVTAQLSNYTVVGSGPVMTYSNDPRALTWSDGTPTLSGLNNNGIYINTGGNGFSFTAPADTTTRILTVHVGGWLSAGTFTASLSDGSAPPFVDTTSTANGQFDRNYTLTYAAGSAGQTLTVSWVDTSGGGNVTLNGAALSSPSSSLTATAGTPQTTAVSTAFATALQATAKDANNNPLSGVTVTFAAPTSGASASFSGSATATATTNSSGVATAPSLTANTQVGSYTVTATASGISSAVTFALSNVAGPPASVTATAGTPQSATVSTSFGAALQATVKDASNNPISGVTVTFTAPATGPSANFSGSASATATTNSSGIATAPTLTANSQVGGYTVTASVAGVTTAASFSLSNTAVVVPQPGSITATAGTPQSATVGTAFSTALQGLVKDTNSNPMSGVTVTFTAPATGASANFGGSLTAMAVTNSSGIATAPTLTANSQVGGYTVTASVAGVSAPANFSLSNTAVVVTSGVQLIQQSAGANLGNNQNTLIVTLGAAPSSSNVLVLMFDQVSASQSITSISGATWTRVAQNVTNNGDSEVWVGTSPSSSSITITGTNYFGGFQPGYAIVAEFSGISSTLDGAELNTASGIWPVITASLNTSSANDLLITSTLSYNGGGVDATVNGAWTSFKAPGGTYSLSAAYESVNSTGTYSATWNGAGTPQVGTIILALKAAGGAPAGPPASITPTSGTPQSATVSTSFGTALQATVKDANNNPVSGVSVTFTAPASGASASFAGSLTAIATTNSSGIATAPTLTANNQIGSYTVTAGVAGLSATASFTLSNTKVVTSSGVKLVQQTAGANLGNNQNTLAVTLAAAPNSGNTLVLIFAQEGASQSITSISGATWTRLVQNASSSNGDSEIWVGTNPSSSNITITGSTYFGGFQPGYAIVAEFSGIGTALDGSTLTTTGGFWPVTTANLTTASAADLLITSTLSYNGGGVDASVNSPWTPFNAPVGTYSLSAAYQVVSGAGSYSATWNGFGSPKVDTIILALKAAGTS